MGFDVAGARAVGYSETEIADFLGRQRNFDTTSARQSGYTDAELIGHLSSAVATPAVNPPAIAAPVAGDEAERNSVWDEAWRRVTTPFVVAKDALGQGVEMAADKIQQGAVAWGQGIGDMIYADSRDQLAPGLMRSLGGVVDMGVGIGRGAFAGVTPLFTFGLEAAKQVPGLDEKAEQVERWMAWPGNMYRQYLGDPDGLNPVPESQPLLRAGWDAFELGAEAAPFATGAEALPVAWRARPRFREIPADMAVLRRHRTESAPVSPVVEALPAVEKAAPVGDAEPLVPGPEVQRVVDDNWNAPAPRLIKAAEPVKSQELTPAAPALLAKINAAFENGGWAGRSLSAQGERGALETATGVPFPYRPTESGYSRNQVSFTPEESRAISQMTDSDLVAAGILQRLPSGELTWTGATPKAEIATKPAAEVPTSRAERRGETEVGGGLPLKQAVENFTETDVDGLPNIYPAYKTPDGTQITYTLNHEPRIKANNPRYFDDAGFWFPFDNEQSKNALFDDAPSGALNGFPELLVEASASGKTGIFISIRELDAAGGDYKAALTKKLSELEAKPAPSRPKVETKEPWQMTKAEWLARDKGIWGELSAEGTGLSAVKKFHEVSVRDALREGKPVPPEVLAEYGLEAKPAAEVPPSTSEPTSPPRRTSRAERRGETAEPVKSQELTPAVAERISAATVQPERGGKVFRGKTHADAYAAMLDEFPNIAPESVIAGFETSTGRIVNRSEAARISNLGKKPRLESEDLPTPTSAVVDPEVRGPEPQTVVDDNWNAWVEPAEPSVSATADKSGQPSAVSKEPWQMPENGGRVELSGGGRLRDDISGTIWQVHNDGRVLDIVRDGDQPGMTVRVNVEDYTSAKFSPPDSGKGQIPIEGKPSAVATPRPALSVEEARAYLNRPGQIMGYPTESIMAKQQGEVPPSTSDLPDVVVGKQRRGAYQRVNGEWYAVDRKTGAMVGDPITNPNRVAELNRWAQTVTAGQASARARRRAGIELPELVEFLQEHGGIMGKNEARRTGRMERLSGEYDDMPQIPLQFRQALFGNGKMTPDQAVQLLINNGRLPEGSKPSDLYRLLERDTAKHTSRAAREREADDRAMAELGVTPEEAAQYERFSQAVAKPSKTAEPVPVAQLKKGDKFRIKGEEFVVTDVSADGTVTVEDGRKFGIRELSEIDPQTNEPVIIPVDKGGVKSRRQRKGEDVSFDVGAMEGETVSNELMAELSAFDEARHGGLHPTPSQKLIDSGLIEKRRGQYRITDEARSNLIEWNKEQKRIKDDAAAAFDLEQEKIYQDIEAGRPIAKADLDKYISPDSPWRDRAIIAESKSKSKSKSTSDEGFTLESVTPEQLRAEQWKAKWDAAKKDNDAAWELHFNLQKMAAAETDPWRKAQLEQQRDEAYAQTQVHKRRLTELANENAGTQTELGAVTAPAERQVAEKLMQGGLKGKGDPVVDAARVLEDQAGGPNAVGAVAPALRQALASGQQDKVTVTRDQMQSVDPNVEARWQAARTPKVGLWQRLKEYAGEVKASFQGRYPELTKQDDAAVIDVLLRQEAAPSLGQARAVQAMEGFTAGFGPNKLELFSRVVILRDLAAAANTDLYAGVNELNFGYTRETLARDLARFEEMARQNPDVARAVERRQKFFDDIKREAVAADMLPASVLEQKDYFHRQVMQYLAAKTMDNSSTLAGRLAIKRRGWQQSRSGSAKDYNTDYLQAEYEVLSQMLTDIETRKNMERVRDLSDIGDRLKRQAKMQNLYTVYGGKEKYDRAMELRAEIKELQQSEDAKESIVRQQLAMGSSVRQQLAILHEERNAIDPLWPFVVRKAVARSIMGKEIYEGKVTGIPERLQAIAEQLSAEYESRRYKTEVDLPELGENDGGYIEFAKWLADSNQPSKTAGLSFFKALADERTFIRETAGDKFVQYLDLMPPGYATWQPDRGNRFYRGLTIADKTAEAVMNGERELTEGDLREQTILGGPKETWVVPERVANTLNNFTSRLEEGPIDRMARTVNNRWKQYKLLGPLRALKYNINNLSGDFDASVMASGHGRGILKELRGAEGDLRRYHLQEGPLTEELATMQRHRVMGSGISVQEIPGIGSTRRLRRMSNERVGPVRRYWEGIGKYTQYREDLLRVAAYRYFLKEIQAGRSPVAASDPVALSRITDPTEKAAKLSRDLLGDYGNISKSGEYLRSHVIPFYSWMEINAPRYVQLLKNAGIEQGTSRRGAQARVVGALAGKAALKTAGKTAVWGARAAGMYALVNLWNHVMFPDEERELAVKSDQLHLILGRNEDGTIRSVRFQGALSDVLGWVGLEDFPQDAMELAEGSKSWGDQAQEMATAPVNRLVNAAYPLLKTPAEAITGKSLYPNVTEPRSIRDPLGHVARALDVEMPYNYLTDKPSRGWQRNVESVATYTVDPGQLAYTRVQDLVSQWQKSKGRPTGVMSRSPRSDALYYYKKSLQYGDTGKADRWKAKYMELGGKEEGIEESVKRAHPISTIPAAEREEFLKSLARRDRQAVTDAEGWYNKVYQPQQYSTPEPISRFQRRQQTQRQQRRQRTQQ